MLCTFYTKMNSEVIWNFKKTKKRKKGAIFFENLLTIRDDCSIIVKHSSAGDLHLIIENWTTWISSTEKCRDLVKLHFEKKLKK